ncbi:MAG: hypothetical protein F6K28_38580 [Microcoleus sp. SIO2G3]|nr:hypothetical protein [Microcoleus sp. SIO2G3]
MKLIVVEIISDVCGGLGYWWGEQDNKSEHRNVKSWSVELPRLPASGKLGR